MSPNDVLLFSQISALASHHQRGFLLQKMGINTETHSQTLHTERDLKPQRSKSDVSI